MRLVRTLLVAGAVVAVAAVAVPQAQALGFADSPCPEAGPGGIRVCPDAVVGQPYTLKLEGSGGCGPALPYQYRLLNGALPVGLSLSPGGHLSGVPTSAGTWGFWVELSDQDPPSASWCRPAKSERQFRIRVVAPAATVGTAYSFALGVPGAPTRMWTLVSGVLPQGLTLDPSGLIAGTPSTPGSFPVSFSSFDEAGHETRIDFTLIVYPQLVVISTRFSPVRIGHPLRGRVKIEGAVGAVIYKVLSGRFPIGVRLDAKTGIVRGTPRKAGVSRLTIQALDSLGRSATGLIVLTVRKGVT